MPIVGRRDRTLLAGLAVALAVLVAGRATERPIGYLFAFTREIERSSGLALGPALLILLVVFIFHLAAKRREARDQAAAAEVDAIVAQAHAADLERLVAFGHSLARSLDLEAIREVILQQLPKLAGSDDAWVMIRIDGRWQALMGAARAARADIERARARTAEQSVDSSGGTRATPITVEGHVCVPLTAAGTSVGVLGVPEAAVSSDEGRRGLLAAAAALLGISIRNAQLFRELRDSSLRDGLTGCFNRTHSLDVIDTELRRARRSQLPLSLIMFDLDRFKDVNDRHGHLCGDAVLAAVGARMRELLRGSDLRCRYGGEEFLVLLPETPLEGAKRVADTLRREIAELPVPWKDEVVYITASFGVTAAMPAEIDVQAVIGRADQALYRAKEQGRNCVRLSIETAVA